MKMYEMDLWSKTQNSSLPAAGHLALSAAGHTGGPPIHHGASVGPRRAPWRVLWALKAAKYGK